MASVNDIEDRLDRLENRLKATFLEVEKRFESLKAEEPFVLSIETRLQELEDLMLLLQLEVTKIRERTGEFEFGAPQTPDIEERLRKMEEALSEKGIKTEPTEPHEPHVAPHLTQKIDKLETRLNELSSKEVKGHERLSTSVEMEIERIEKRLERLENEKIAKAVKSGTLYKGVLEDVNEILYS